MSKKLRIYHSLRAEQGAALMVALVILTMVTVIGVASLKESVMQSRIATLTNASGIAFQAADSAVESAIAEIQSNVALVEGQPQIMARLVRADEVHRCVGSGEPPDGCAPLQGPGNVLARSVTMHTNIPDRTVTGSSINTLVWRFYMVRGTGSVGADALTQVTHQQEFARRELASNEVYEDKRKVTSSAL